MKSFFCIFIVSLLLMSCNQKRVPSNAFGGDIGIIANDFYYKVEAKEFEIWLFKSKKNILLALSDNRDYIKNKLKLEMSDDVIASMSENTQKSEENTLVKYIAYILVNDKLEMILPSLRNSGDRKNNDKLIKQMKGIVRNLDIEWINKEKAK